ncbi:hypothetical protein EUGRSUZ_F01796, partial [Eucalyptus grandis]
MKPVSLSFAEFRSCRLLLGIALVLCFNRVSCTTNETDRLALLDFKAGISEDPFGVLSSWNDSIGFCQWYGVICGRRHRRVMVLDLQSQGLFGSISPHIGNLSFLRKMLLQNNSFNQKIPPQLGQLHRLRILGLTNNSLIGEIPKNISDCSDLVFLRLGNNELTGEIPREIGSLLKLRQLLLHGNNLIGSMPSSIGNLSSLELLFLTKNNLSGSIPQVLGHLKNLQLIGFAANEVSGTIPSSLLNLSSLATFDAGENQIQGTVPASIGLKLPILVFFSVWDNQLEGAIPLSISNCTKLDVLEFGGNRFFGKVPSLENLYNLNKLQISDNQLGDGEPEDLNFLCSLTNNSKLRYAVIGSNKFGGVLPTCVDNLSITLTCFDVRENQIFGKIPEEIGNFINLEELYMNLNKLSGVIPSNLGNLRNLSKLDLGYNNLGGTIPSSLGNLTKLIGLYLDGNNFHGQIPSPLSNCLSLNLLDLSNNNLSGVIPSQLMSLPSLTILLNLSRNHLTRVLPSEVGNLRSLTALDISNNLLVGEIPSGLGGCTSLTSLRMGGNFFHGSIPQSMRSLGGIEELDLSCNNLSGQIPEFLTVFRSLKLLNLSYNKFEGVLPYEGVFRNATSTSIIGNNKLCEQKDQFSDIVHLCYSRSSWNSSYSSFHISLMVEKDDVSYGTFLKATDGFSSTNLIGARSFGSIYRGVLEVSGTTIAVKVLHLVRHGALKSFNVECEALKNIRHRNLLKILTVCSGSDYQGNDFKALVYEFMDNGSLERWLHPSATSSHRNGLPRKLNFIQRINIAIGVASALDYLHHQCHIPIIHCDLKPSNILLDSEMVAHVGDFGLAKFLYGSSFDTAANHMSSEGFRGTIGYAPPEYAMGCEVSREGDIYSYGILLLEMFTGLSPTDDTFRDNLTLHGFVAKALLERVLEIMDSALLQERESHLGPYNLQHDIFPECLVMIYNIGVACSNEVLERRMSIGGVTNRLHQIREKLLASGLHGQ